MAWDWHRPLEAKGITFTVLTLVAILVGGLVELVPPYFLQGTIEAIEGVKPYSALELEGRDLYIREGCNNCHSQMIRPFKTETDRYGPFSMPGEGVYDRPFLYGSRRTGPDLVARRRQVSRLVALDPPAQSARDRAALEHAALRLPAGGAARPLADAAEARGVARPRSPRTASRRSRTPSPMRGRRPSVSPPRCARTVKRSTTPKPAARRSR